MASAQDAEDALVDAAIFFVGSEAGDARAPVLQSYIGSQARVVILRGERSSRGFSESTTTAANLTYAATDTAAAAAAAAAAASSTSPTARASSSSPDSFFQPLKC